jgi:aspartate/methionine/tyrosine aminotransferase
MATCGLISRHLLPSALALLRPAFTWVSFSKILAPGLRLGFAVAPPALFPKLLQAKQAVDLHTPIFNQRVAYEVLTSGIMDQHVQAIRILYKQQRDAMLTALETHMPEGVRWNKPDGGSFYGCKCQIRFAPSSCERRRSKKVWRSFPVPHFIAVMRHETPCVFPLLPPASNRFTAQLQR